MFSEPNEFVPSQGLTIEFIYAEDNTLDYNPDNPAFSGEIAYISGKPQRMVHLMNGHVIQEHFGILQVHREQEYLMQIKLVHMQVYHQCTF